jgi:alkylation response protein AidB-like acyl-CoA dehydrogenase
LPDLLSGKRVATAALLGPDPVAACAVTATRDGDSGDDWTLSGTIAHVLDAAVADTVLALASHEGGLALFAIDTHDTQAHGVTVTARRTSDLTRRVASITLDTAPARLVGGLGQGAAIADAVRPQALLALACEQTGGAQAALDQAVAYAGQRQQFGRAIGSFQAVKHKLADVLIAVEESRSATWATARALDAADTEAHAETKTDGGSDAALFALATAAVCSTAYVKAASDNVQVHGGIGYTWEHGAHLHVKRSRGSAVLFGTPAEHRQALSRLLPLLQDPATTAPTSIPSAVDADRTPVTEGASR